MPTSDIAAQGGDRSLMHVLKPKPGAEGLFQGYYCHRESIIIMITMHWSCKAAVSFCKAVVFFCKAAVSFCKQLTH